MHFTNPRIAKQRDAKPALFVRSNARSSRSQSIDVPLRPASSIGISHDEVGLGHSIRSWIFLKIVVETKRFFCVKLFQLRNPSHWVGYFALSGENFNKVTILSYAWSATLFWKDEWAKTTLIYLYTCLASVFFAWPPLAKATRKHYKLSLGSLVCGICVFHCTSSARRISTGGACQRNIS